MKIRTGFISNSSSSSFIVKIKESEYDFLPKDPSFLADEEVILKLEEYGFRKSHITSPFDHRDKIITKNSDHYESMKYWVSCNEDDVICFLVKNNIPFKASCHYGHRYISYKKDSDYVFKANNFGLALNMYGEDCYDYIDVKNFVPFEKIPKKEYLETNNNHEGE